MGEPFVPSDHERERRRAAARIIVASIRDDEDTETIVSNIQGDGIGMFELAQEIEMLVEERRMLYLIHDAAHTNRDDATRLRRIDEALERVRWWRAEMDAT